MPGATFNFPRGFLWGTATASHQVEGNNKNNNFWAWEQEPGRIIDGHKSVWLVTGGVGAGGKISIA